MNRWYVAQTHRCDEEKAAWQLRRQEFSVYLPRYLTRRRHARRVDWVKAPLFPRYLFIEMDSEHTQWRCINSTFGVSRLVCNGDRPAPVPEGIVEDIVARSDNRGLVRLDRMRPFSQGQKVQIMFGALTERVGMFECLTDEDRVVLLLDMLGRQVRIKLPLETIAPYA